MTVNIAQLKNHLSAYLQRVRAGEEIVIRDRNLPVAKLVSLSAVEASAEELAMVARGELLLPAEPLDEDGFWAVGAEVAASVGPAEALSLAVTEDREERDASLLGR
jgi:prevent-host-death family protein